MRLTTQMYATFRNVGQPTQTRMVSGNLAEITKQQMLWMAEITLSKGIRVDIARTAEELGSEGKKIRAAEYMSDIFDEIADQVQANIAEHHPEMVQDDNQGEGNQKDVD